MSFAAAYERIKEIKIAFQTLSKSFPPPNVISVISEKDFKNINQREAYEVLRYLLHACGKGQFNKCLDDNIWKKFDKESKLVLEKMKNEVIDAVKSISKEEKVVFLPLKKSDLMVPYRPLFFICCAGLSSYALSFQLGLMGMEFWPKSFEEARNTFERFNEEFKSITDKYEESKRQLEELNREANLFEEMKREAMSSIVQTLTGSSTSTDVVHQCLQDRRARAKYMINQADELHRANLEKLTRLKRLDQSLKSLVQMSESTEKVVIDGKDIMSLIPYETEAFARREGIPLFENGSFSIQRLLEAVIKSFRKPRTIRRYSVSKLLESLEQIKPYQWDTDYVKRITEIRDEFEPLVTSGWDNLRANSDVEADNIWIENFFVKVPAIIFVPNPPIHRKPFIDLEKIDRLTKKRMRHDADSISTEVQDSGANLTGNITSVRYPLGSRREAAEKFLAMPSSSKQHTIPTTGSPFLNEYSRSCRGMVMSLNKNQSSSPVTNHPELSATSSSVKNDFSSTIREESRFLGGNLASDICPNYPDISPICHINRKFDSTATDNKSHSMQSCSLKSDDVVPEEDDSINISDISSLYINREYVESDQCNTTRDTFDESIGEFPSLEDITI